MGKPTGFIEENRITPNRKPVHERIENYQEIYLEWSADEASAQGARCMNCAVPFCHMGCPLGNLIPDWNDLVYRGEWEKALQALHSTNNFPEFTGRICPAPCEASCVLAINQDPVTIEHIEKAIADTGWEKGWIHPIIPNFRSGKNVAIVGSGPAGLAAAQLLNRQGHSITVFERNESVGGLLRFGIPNFKLEKHIVQRRVDQLSEEGVVFKTSTFVGHNFPTSDLIDNYDAICLTGGSTVPRDLNIPGRDLNGIHFAMEYLTQQNRLLDGVEIRKDDIISAKDKDVIILGGGDTGADCLGTAHRQGARSVKQFEIMPEPPITRDHHNPWPEWPRIMMTSAAHEEGGAREYNISSTKFSGENGTVSKLHGIKVDWEQNDSNTRPKLKEINGSDFEISADLILLAMGFLHPEHTGMLNDLQVETDSRGNVATNQDKMTNMPGVFSAGDMARGQSLVVWAIAEGREVARGIDKYLTGKTSLPRVLNDH